MAECKHYESVREDGITVLVKKDDPDVVIVARKRLLEVCTACPDEPECETIKELRKVLKQ